MAKKTGALTKTVSFLAWLTGVVVSLAVGFALTEGVLVLPKWLGGATAVGLAISLAAGWIVIALTIIGAILAIVSK